jgi:hypothetical protein
MLRPHNILDLITITMMCTGYEAHYYVVFSKLLEFVAIFLSPFGQILEQYIKIDHDRFFYIHRMLEYSAVQLQLRSTVENV